ncbi:hypothetical protein [Methanobrevibacter sp.]|uniref:hypothetical protein n=1 Tax=Methanobrevibacter sp. TaxID=66852 RepID=UPI00388ECCB9
MNENLDCEEIRIIKEVFDETREITGYASPEMTEVNEDCYKGGDIFITEGGELIDLECQMKDFDEVELANYVELAENLYEKNKVPISIYILCPNTIQVTAPECTIKSEAIFNIKLACYNSNPVYDALYHIKDKVNRNMKLNDEDMEVLIRIPVMGPKKDRKNLRIECFRILKKSLETR